MLEGLVGGLIVAWILSLFGFDHICIQAMRELLSIDISKASYYFIFAMIGLIGGIIAKDKR